HIVSTTCLYQITFGREYLRVFAERHIRPLGTNVVYLAPCTISVHIVIAASSDGAHTRELRLHLRHGRTYHFLSHLPAVQFFDCCSRQPSPSFNNFLGKSDATQYQLLPVVACLGAECTDG